MRHRILEIHSQRKYPQIDTKSAQLTGMGTSKNILSKRVSNTATSFYRLLAHSRPGRQATRFPAGSALPVHQTSRFILMH
jgi:hypothetical protein